MAIVASVDAATSAVAIVVLSSKTCLVGTPLDPSYTVLYIAGGLSSHGSQRHESPLLPFRSLGIFVLSTMPQASSVSCINEYLAVDGGGNVSE